MFCCFTANTIGQKSEGSRGNILFIILLQNLTTIFDFVSLTLVFQIKTLT